METVCIGGGPAGLYLAILLKRASPQNRVIVYERYPRGEVCGWGVVFWDDLLDDLRETDPVTAELVRQNAFEWRGQELHMAGELVRVEGGGCGIARWKLLEILIDRAIGLGVEVHFDHPVTGADQFPNAAVIAAADGINSALRSDLADEFGTEVFAGRNKYVWLGSDKVFDAFTFAFEQTEKGWIWFHAYGVEPGRSTCVVECSPETWRGLGLDRLPAQQALRLLGSIFHTAIDGYELLSQGDLQEPLPWQSFRTITNRRWHSGKTVLLGDAAHTAHFSIGSGMRLAFRDAIALAESLQQVHPTELAFSAYQNQRRSAAAAIQRDAWFSARWLEQVERYATRPPQEFFGLLRARRDPLQSHISPRLYYRLYSAADRNPTLRRLKSRLGPKARHGYGQLVRRF